MTTNITETPPAALAPRTSTAARKASDTRMGRETDRLNQSISAIRKTEEQALASLRPVLSGRARDTWETEEKRTKRGHQRASGALAANTVVDPTAKAVEQMRAAGEAGEPVDADGALVAKLVAFHQAQTAADALAAARIECDRQAAAALTAAVHAMRRELVNAVAADLRDIATEAETVAAQLDGVDSADEAITRGVVSAWKSRADIAERTIEAAQSLHWVRRRADRGFIVDGAGRVDAWPLGNDERHSSARTWETLGDILTTLGTSDAARALMTGEA